MSTITQWRPDYTTTDLNFPADIQGIAFPVDGVSDLGFVLRDIKAVARGQTLDRLFEPDTHPATFVSSTSFTMSGDFRAVYPAGIAARFVVAGGTVFTWIHAISFAAGTTTFTTSTAVLTSPITSVQFSALKPGSTAALAANGYPDGVGSPFAYRIGQRGQFQITDPNTTVVVEYLHREIDLNYRILLQAVSASALASNAAYRSLSIVRTATGFTYTTGAAGGGVSVVWEYQIVRGT